MKSLELSGFTQLSADDLQNIEGGGLFSNLIGTVTGLITPVGALLDSLVASLPIPALPTLPGGLGNLPL